MNRRQFACATAATLALAGTGGCDARAPALGGMLRLAAPARFDPKDEFDDPGLVRTLLTGATQAGLVARDGRGALVPALARTWAVTDDGLTYMFRLRPDLRRADGSILDARAVVERLQQVRADAAVRPALRPLGAIADVASPAPGMVQIDLSHPMPALLGWLALPALSIAARGVNPPASGPFALADPAAAELRLTPNAAYFDAARVRLGEIRITPAGGSERALRRFRDGEADIVTGLAMEGLIAARAFARAALRLESSWGVYGYRVNPASALLRDPRIRRALALAIDRPGLISRLFGVLPQMRPADGPLPPALAGPEDVAGWMALPADARRAEAGRLLAEAGWSPDVPLDLAVAIAPGEEHAAIVSEVARQLAALGLRLRVQPLPPPDLAMAAVMPEGVDLVGQELVAAVDDPAWFVAALLPEVGDPWRQDARDALLRSDAFIALCSPARWSLVRPEVGGWEANEAGAHPLDRLDKASGPARVA